MSAGTGYDKGNFDERREIFMAELLIKTGANVNAKDSSGSTALMYAEMNGATKVASVLRKHGAK